MHKVLGTFALLIVLGLFAGSTFADESGGADGYTTSTCGDSEYGTILCGEGGD